MSELKEKDFSIEGMTCASCVSHVEKAAKKVSGVKEAKASLLTNSLKITYEGNLKNEEIEKSIAKAGYKAKLISENDKDLGTDISQFDNKKELKGMIIRLIPTIIFLLPLLYLGMGSMLDWPIGYLKENLLNLALIELLLSLLILSINFSFFKSGIISLIHKNPNMDTLVALGSGVSFIYSVVLLFLMNDAAIAGYNEKIMHLSMNLSFESAGVIPAFILIGKTLETFSKDKTSSAIAKLAKLEPSEASILINGKEEKIATKDIKKGDLLLIRPGEHFPVDGIVKKGASCVDESAISGESLPVNKEIDSSVYSGSINKDGYLEIEATLVGKETTIQKIIQLVKEASESKPRIAKIADKVAGIFIPSVLLISLVVFLSWLIFGADFVSTLPHSQDTLSYAFERSLSVLVVSCPCSLGLATPLAVMVSSGKGAKEGLLFKNAESLEECANISYIVFDKTGTLTKGEMFVTDIIPYKNIQKDELLLLAYSLEKGSEHPLAKAIRKKGEELNLKEEEISSLVTHSGKGVSGIINNFEVFGGNLSFISNKVNVEKEIIEDANKLSLEGKTVLYFAKHKAFYGLIALADTPKEEAKEVIKKIKREGYTPLMLTGDNEGSANKIAKDIGIDYCFSELLPKDKVSIIEKLKKEGKVLMVGDGINDAPALTSANIGMAIGKGSDIAIESADIILMRNDLNDVYKAIHLSKACLMNIKENLFWAFLYNTAMIPIAAGAFSGLGLTSLKPWMGAAAMSLSSISVVLNALRINLINLGKRKQTREGKKLPKDLIKEDIGMKTTIKVEGMMCQMCATHVKKALENIGATNVEVNLEKKEATFEIAKFDKEQVKTAIADTGYVYKDN